MNNIKTIADFKRAMRPGTHWEATHRYIGENPTEPKSLGLRECGHVQSNRFAFKTDHDTLSWCDWPTRDQFSTEDNGNVVVITTPGFCELKYIERN